MEHTLKSERTNLIIRCNGNGNEISENVSNVLMLYRRLRKMVGTEAQ